MKKSIINNKGSLYNIKIEEKKCIKLIGYNHVYINNGIIEILLFHIHRIIYKLCTLYQSTKSNKDIYTYFKTEHI